MTDPLREGEKKKGLSGLAWAGLGCGAVLLIALVAAALLVKVCNKAVHEISSEMQKNPERKITEMVIGMHPDFSVVSSNDDTKQMTIKEDKTGKEMTFSYKDITDGKFGITDSDGTTAAIGSIKAEDLPSWVPLPTAAKISSGFQSVKNGKTVGMVVLISSNKPEDVIEFYESATNSWSSGTLSKNKIQIGNVNQHSFEKSASDKKINVMTQTSSTGTQVTVTFEEK
jgi:hypothetical protein